MNLINDRTCFSNLRVLSVNFAGVQMLTKRVALAQGWRSFPNKCHMCANMQEEMGGPELAKELKDEEVHPCGLLETMFP